MTREADLIEEVGRLEGFDRLPRRLPAARERVGRLSREQLLRRRAEDVLSDLGFDEIVAWHFVSPALADELRLPPDDARRDDVRTGNPLSEEQSAMRTNLLGGLLDAARHNLARGAERVSLFESGRAYLREAAPSEGGPFAGEFEGDLAAPVREPHRLAGLAIGPLREPTWSGGEPAEGFYALKGVLEALCDRLAVPITMEPGSQPFLHPGRAASLLAGETEAGWLGELHPQVAAAWDLPGGAAFELDLATVLAASGAGTEHSRTWPASRRSFRTSRSSWPTTCRRRRSGLPSWRRRASCSTPRASSTSTGRPGRGREQEPGAPAGVPRARQDAHRRGGGRAPRGDQGRNRKAGREPP